MKTLILYATGDGKGNPVPRKLTRRNRKLVHDCVVLDLDSQPPRVLVSSPTVSWPFYGGLLPAQFIDHNGNLRNAKGEVVFRKTEPNPLDDRVETTRYPYIVHRGMAARKGGYSDWIVDKGTQPSVKLTSEDLTELISVLDPVETKYLRP